MRFDIKLVMILLFIVIIFNTIGYITQDLNIN